MFRNVTKRISGQTIGLLSFCLLHLSATSLDAQTVTAEKQYYDTGARGEFEITQGYRQDKLTWSVSGKHHKPNILSELQFKDVRIYQTRIAAKFTMNDYFLRMQAGYGDIHSGHIRDSDYGKDDRRGEFSRSRSKITGSHTLDAKLSWGLNIKPVSYLRVSPLLGYMWNLDKFRFKHGTQTRLFGEKFHEKIHGLHSTYKSRWDAPFIGVGAGYDPLKDLSIYGEYNFLFALRNSARGFWNLRNEGRGMHFDQHSKRSKGYGHIAIGGIGYEFFENYILKVEYQYSWFQAKGGKIHGHEGHHSFRQPFHKAKLTSQEVRLCLDYAF